MIQTLAKNENPNGISPARFEKCREAFRLQMSGLRQTEIAERLNTSRSTVCRLLRDYNAAYVQSLEETPKINLIAAELEKLNQYEEAANRDAEAATTDRDKQAFKRLAMSAAKERQSLMIQTGILPKEPDKLYHVTQQLRTDDEKKRRPRTDDEIKESLINLLEHRRGFDDLDEEAE